MGLLGGKLKLIGGGGNGKVILLKLLFFRDTQRTHINFFSLKFETNENGVHNSKYLYSALSSIYIGVTIYFYKSINWKLLLFTFIRYIAATLLGGGIVYYFTSLSKIIGPSHYYKKNVATELNLNYTDFVTIMFSGATLLLTGVALIVGIVAVFSYRGIKREARNSIITQAELARSDMQSQLKTQMENYIKTAGAAGDFDVAFERVLISKQESPTSNELEMDFDPDDNGER